MCLNMKMPLTAPGERAVSYEITHCLRTVSVIGKYKVNLRGREFSSRKAAEFLQEKFPVENTASRDKLSKAKFYMGDFA